MKNVVLPLALTAGLLVNGAAQAQGPASSNVEKVVPGSYAIESDHTQLLFSVGHLGFSNYDGFFSKASGTLRLDPKALSATVLDVTVPVASVSTTSVALDKELLGNERLDAARYPAIHLNSTKITRTGPKSATIAGNLTLHGVTRLVTLEGRFIGSGIDPLSKAYTVGFEVKGTIKRSDFGVKTYLPMIGDDVNLKINAAFVKGPS